MPSGTIAYFSMKIALENHIPTTVAVWACWRAKPSRRRRPRAVDGQDALLHRQGSGPSWA